MGRGRRKRAPSPSGDERLRKRGASRDSREVRRRGRRLPGTAARGRLPGGGRPGGRALPPPPGGAQLRSGRAGLRVTCALAPVAGDHGLAGDGVQPGGALRLLAAGVREGAETQRERGRGSPEGAEAAQTPLALPLAGPPPAPGPRAAPGSLLDEEDSAAPGDPVRPGPGQGADPLQVQIRRHV